ncbi:MAG TPA: hypothetical protein VFY90_00255 [Tepidiformaceae bacterium]|nr:hypothetical protein [Tepidiformaceae bacterium]
MRPAELRRQIRQRAQAVRRSLSLVSSEYVHWGATFGPPDGGWLEVRGEQPLRAGGLDILFSIREVFWAEVDGSLELRSSRYTVVERKSGHEIFAYHQHPPDPSWVHLHLGAGAGQLHPLVRSAHFPALVVALDDVLALLIRDFGLSPTRPDWEKRLRIG